MFNKIILQKEAALNPWYLAAVTQLVTGTEAHPSGWLSHELGEGRRMGVLSVQAGRQAYSFLPPCFYEVKSPNPISDCSQASGPHDFSQVPQRIIEDHP